MHIFAHLSWRHRHKHHDMVTIKLLLGTAGTAWQRRQFSIARKKRGAIFSRVDDWASSSSPSSALPPAQPMTSSSNFPLCRNRKTIVCAVNYVYGVFVCAGLRWALWIAPRSPEPCESALMMMDDDRRETRFSIVRRSELRKHSKAIVNLD